MSIRKKVLILTLTLTTLSINGVTMADTEYDFLLNSISQDKKVPAEKLEDLMDSIAMWESDFAGKKQVKIAKDTSQIPYVNTKSKFGIAMDASS